MTAYTAAGVDDCRRCAFPVWLHRLNTVARSFQPINRRDPDEDRIHRTAKKRMISAELEDFLRYLNSPWHIVWRNLLVGLARGLGAVFGATVVVGLSIWVLKIFVDLPLIGDYARDFRDRVTEMAEETRYTDDFARLQSTMERIDLRLKQQNELLETLSQNEESVR